VRGKADAKNHSIMKKETAIIVEIKLYELVDYSISYGSLECELVDCSLFLLVALLFARI